MGPTAGTALAVLQIAVLEGARALGVRLLDLVVGTAAMAVVGAALLYLLVSLRLAAVMERVRNL